jgi:hypothetical protein
VYQDASQRDQRFQGKDEIGQENMGKFSYNLGLRETFPILTQHTKRIRGKVHRELSFVW